MKRCPQCYEAYADSERFCELDGQLLLADPAATVIGSEESAMAGSDLRSNQSSAQSGQQREIWMVGTAGVLVGIVVCAGGYLAFSLWNSNSALKDTGTPAFATQSQELAPRSTRQQVPRPEASASPAEPAETEPEASPDPQPAPKQESNTVAAHLNQGPVSTGQRKKSAEDTASVQTIIEMNDGTSVEVDAAWEDGQGVWYRRGGMVAFVDSQRVKAITGRAAQKPSSVPQ